MRIISEKNFEKLNNTVLTIGKFDGLHKGHQKILAKMLELKEEGLESVVFAFKKAPKEVLGLENMEYILTEEEKEMFLENRSVDYYIQYPCDEVVLNTTAEDFVRDIIVEKIGAKVIVCGTDFCFGKNRMGDIHLLKALSKEYDFEVIVLDKIQYENSDISSTRIREAVKCGDIEYVNKLLGYNYTVIGQVVCGAKLGRTIGFPTANIVPNEKKLLPPAGVYYTKAVIDGIEYAGITNVGVKPTVSGEGKMGIETCFLEYEGDLYGENIEIQFLKFVRKEMKFESVELLKEQIKRDVSGRMKFKG